MALTARLDIRQAQGLVMTPQLQQAIKLLQLNNQELASYVDGELEQNPFLDKDEGDGPAMADAVAADNLLIHDNPSSADSSDASASVEDASGWETDIDASDRDTFDDTSSVTMPTENDDPGDSDYDNNWSSADAPGLTDPGGTSSLSNWRENSGGGQFGDDEFSLEQTLEARTTLRDHLLAQLSLDTDHPAERLIGLHLIEMVDDSGYLVGDIDTVASQLNCQLSEVEAILNRLQHFDPPGIMARSLAECLGAQLRDKNRLDPAMQALLDNLDLLAKRDLPTIRKLCEVDQDDLVEMIAEIRALNPKPGEGFMRDDNDVITPDVIMRPRPDGGWLVELNADNLPRVLVNNSYLAEVNVKNASKEDRGYINQCQQSANWLVKALNQRATTILKVATEIIRQQEGFFLYGIQYLKPLVLRDIAEAIEMHESTVSRVTSNKFMASPRGIFELKYFFTASIATADGGANLSAEAVRARIKALIDAESPKKILSDDKLVDILRAEGIDIARRTVAKYREALRLPSSVQRRREKAMSL